MTSDPAAVLDALEARLDPARPEATGGVEVIGYGEVSAALRVPGIEGRVCKRMAGLRDDAAAAAYLALVAEYLRDLPGLGVAVLPTETVLVPRAGRAPVVYLLQPEVAVATLGQHVVAAGDDDALRRVVRAVLDRVLGLHRADAERTDGVEVAIDAQLSNWTFAGADPGAEPQLLDVGTPFVRRGGRHAFDVEVFLSAVPAGLRAYYRRKREVEAYLDDYFVPRLVALDLLGNLRKERLDARLPAAVSAVNAWFAEHAADVPAGEPITVADVDAYYAHDASQLALFLRLRRADRALRRLVRSRYDFLLPGPVAR